MASIPQARIVRNQGLLVTPPPFPPSEAPGALRTALAYAIGLWPLTAVVALMLGLLVMAANNGAP